MPLELASAPDCPAFAIVVIRDNDSIHHARVVTRYLECTPAVMLSVVARRKLQRRQQGSPPPDGRSPGAAVLAPFQRRFSPGWHIRCVTGPRGEVVIMVLGDRSEEMEITLINCQADKPDEAACHHIP
jgi:hypothetical protein